MKTSCTTIASIVDGSCLLPIKIWDSYVFPCTYIYISLEERPTTPWQTFLCCVGIPCGKLKVLSPSIYIYIYIYIYGRNISIQQRSINILEMSPQPP